MPISIGSLRAVLTPAFSSFNPFIKRLPPPKKYVFEPRQVLPGDVVDPYNYLRALFRGEVILTSEKLPTFASPRVWGMTTASTLNKPPGAMYTTRSPQGFNPWLFNNKKTATSTTRTTTKPTSFFGNLGLSSKGVGTDVEHVPLPVGMLGTPAPDFKNFNFKKFVEDMKKKNKPMGGKINVPLSDSTKVNDANDLNAISNTNFKIGMKSSPVIQSPAIENFIKSVQNKQLPTMQSVMNSFKHNDDRGKTLEEVVKNLRNKDVPTIEDIMKKINKPVFTAFPSIPAVPVPDKRNKKTDSPFAAETEVPSVKSTKITFESLPAVPRDEIKPKTHASLTKPFPSFQHFPSSTTERQQVIQQRKNKAISFERTIEVSGERKSKALQKLKDLLLPVSKTQAKDMEVSVRNNPELYRTSFSPSTQRSVEKFKSQFRTSTVKPNLPHGTIRSEIMNILKAQKKTTSTTTTTRTTTSTPRNIPQHSTINPKLFELLQLRKQQQQQTTSPPKVQQTTSRAEVLALLQQFLQSVKPATTTTTTTSTTTTTMRTTMEATTRNIFTTSMSTRLFKPPPRLRFEDDPAPAQPRVNIDLTSISPISYKSPVTTASPIHPRSPFPNMEPPQHDVIKSNIFLPNPVQTVVPTSTVHPLSPFQHLEPPGPASGSLEFSGSGIFPTPGDTNSGFLTGTFSNPNFAIPRSDLLPYDPARPHLPPQNPTEKPGQFKLFLGGGTKDLTRAPRRFNDNPRTPSKTIYPVPRTRMIAPESKQPAINRRLIVDGPTEKSMTPLEILAKGTVPTLPPDKSIFGTPKSRLLEAQSPLEKLSANLKNNFHHGVGFGELEPVERTRFQRKEEENQRQKTFGSFNKVQISGPTFDYNNLPGVQTGTTAVGLVEHRKNNQPIFHVPIFTTPIPKNGQFLNLKPNPLKGFQSGLKRITSRLSDAIKLPNIPSPAEGFQRLKKIFGGNVGAAQEVRDIQITAAPRHLTRRLDTFSRYTKFGNGGESQLSYLNLIIICCLINHLVKFYMF